MKIIKAIWGTLVKNHLVEVVDYKNKIIPKQNKDYDLAN
jgi:hypothetical protein